MCNYMFPNLQNTQTLGVYCFMFYLNRAIFWEISFGLVLLVLSRPIFSRKPSHPRTFLWCQLTTGYMQSMLTPTCTNNQQKKTAVNQQVSSILFTHRLYNQPSGAFSTNLQVLFQLCSFLQCSCRRHTHICWKHTLQSDFNSTLNFAKHNIH